MSLNAQRDSTKRTLKYLHLRYWQLVLGLAIIGIISDSQRRHVQPSDGGFNLLNHRHAKQDSLDNFMNVPQHNQRRHTSFFNGIVGTSSAEIASSPTLGLRAENYSPPYRTNEITSAGLRNTFQCKRDYGAALDFIEYYPSKDSCPNLPHRALVKGRRQSTVEAPGTAIQGPLQVDGCKFKWFYPEEACQLIGSVGILFFTGDSLIRQLMVGLGAVMDGNFRSGGLTKLTPKEHSTACQCEKQWQCWKDPTGHRFGPNQEQFGICPHWTRNHIYSGDLEKVSNETERGHLPITIVANGAPLHNRLDLSLIQPKLENYQKASKALGGVFIPMTVHWPGPNKPRAYQGTQGVTAVERYNHNLRKWSSQQQGVWPLETYHFTKGMWSRDGVHYDDDNIVLVQILLNQLYYLQKHGKLQDVPESNRDDPSNFLIGSPGDVGVQAYTGAVPRPY